MANRIFLECPDASGPAAVVSEELEEAAPRHCDSEAEYLVCLDPIEGRVVL